MKLFTVKKLALISAIALLTGCGGSEQNISGDPVAPSDEQLSSTSASIVMDFANGDIPFPHDALFSGTQDYTLNIPVDDDSDFSDPAAAMNALDGFSTSAPITFKLTKAMDTTDSNMIPAPDTLEAGVMVYPTTVAIVNGAKVVTAVETSLTLGYHYIPVASSSSSVAIMPLRPLEPNKTYLVVAKDSLLDVDGNNMVRGIVYEQLAGTEDLTGTSLEPLEPLRQLTNAHLAALANYGEDVSEVIGSWTFSTQSVGAVLTNIKTNLVAPTITITDDESAALTTNQLNAALSGDAKVYRGHVTLPYFSTAAASTDDPSPLQKFWTGAGDSFLTQYNPTPVKTTDVTVPLIFTKPDGGSKPENGWPVVIFQHGITANRMSVLAIADTLAKAGYASIAIDMPLHGLDAVGYFSMEGISERHFGLDLVEQDETTGAITATGPDGTTDTSGRHFINLTSLLTTRDNIRQAVSDLIHLKAGLNKFTGLGSSVIDPTDVSFVGHSLGAMVGSVFTNLETDIQTAVFANGGLQAAYLLAGSPAFGPEINAGLAAQGVATGSADYNQFLLAAQTIVDSADPVNYVAGISAPSLLLEVVGDGVDASTQDQVVPNSVATAPLAGTEPWITLQGLNSITSFDENTGVAVVTDGKGAIRFNAGDHRSLLDPTTSGVLEVTQTMQEATGSFLATDGAAISVSSNSTIQQ